VTKPEKVTLHKLHDMKFTVH